MAVIHFSIVVILLFSSVSARSVLSRAARQSPATSKPACSPAFEWRCHDGHCIGKTQLCNGMQDCIDNSDETNCSGTTEQPVPTMASAASSKGMSETCMTQWISVFDGNVSTAERTDLAEAMSSWTPPIDEKTAKASSVLVLGFFFGGRTRAQEFIKCISKGTRRCTELAPCRNGGKCLFDSVSHSPSQHYRCVCLPGYTGQACEQGLSPCVRNPCQNGGVCQNVNAADYQCACSALFKGKNCETRWLSENTIRYLSSTINTLAVQVSGVEQKQEVEQRQRWTAMMNFMKNISTAFSARTERFEQEVMALKDKIANPVPVCPSSSLLGYKYTSRYAMNDGSNPATLMSLRFRKKLPNTLLRMSFSSNVGMHDSGKAARWFLKIDGQECSNSSKLDIALYQTFANQWILTPSVLKGICKSTSSGNIGKGFHTITVHVGKEPSYALGAAHTGWQSTSFLEVQEICPPF